MVKVTGSIVQGPQDEFNYEVELLGLDSITQNDMPIPESTKLIIDEVNKKYKTNFPYSSIISVNDIK